MLPIYKVEIDDGLADIIRASASFGILAEVQPLKLPSSPDTVISSKQRDKCREIFNSIAEANPDQFDLYYLQSVLVSVGWNKNDDVFDRYETWNARATPVDKPFNYMHDSKDIIGHMTSSQVISDGSIISFNTPLDDVPEIFDIIVGSVLYRSWPDEELQKRMDKIITEISQGVWKVSMECLFANFDYAIITPKGDNQVIKRDKTSAFLTKHLRIYGGNGIYQDYKIGRLLRNFTFSGKGLVSEPANPKSQITGYSDQGEVRVFSSAAEVHVDKLNKEELTMTDITYTQEQYAFLKDELDGVKADLIKKNGEIESLKKQVAELDETQKSELEKKDEEAKGILIEKDKEIVEFNEKLEKAEADYKEAQKEIDKIKAEAKKISRMHELMQREVTEEKAKALLEKFDGVNDEMFTELVSALPEKSQASDDDSDDIADEAADAIDQGAVDSGDSANLSIADEDETKNVCSAVASWIGGSILKSTKNIKKEE